MSTFSKQDDLPSLPVPTLEESLRKYVKSASAILTNRETETLKKQVEEFEKSSLARQLQEGLENRARNHRNWLDEWWYDAYNEIREPLAPFVSFGAINSHYTAVPRSQLVRAAEVAHGWIQVWNVLRKEQWPITKNRGTTWDMIQFHNLFNSNRTPTRPKDVIQRFFRTEKEGSCPSHFIVNCQGVLWKVHGLKKNGDIKSWQDLYYELDHINRISDDNTTQSIVSLTTTNRNQWADNWSDLKKLSKRNEENLQDVISAMFVVSLSDDQVDDKKKLLKEAMLSKSWLTWQDKSISAIVNTDGQVLLQGDHSNIDAIVLLQAHDQVTSYVRKNPTRPVGEVSYILKKRQGNIQKPDFELPKMLNFDLDEKIRKQILTADYDYEKTKALFRVKAVDVNAFGNDLCRASKVYTDTVVQLALQLAFAKTHGYLAPIYETASTRKFWSGRTETVRGCTEEFSQFQQAVLRGAEKSEMQQKFLKAAKAHDKLMAECMAGEGFDRHLFGLKKTLELMNGKGCSPKRSLPEFMTDESWNKAGGGGNFLLSTSFIGYMNGDEPGTVGYVCAMRPDGYGCFYKIGKNRIIVTISDYVNTKSDLDAFGRNVEWAFGFVQKLLPEAKVTSNL